MTKIWNEKDITLLDRQHFLGLHHEAPRAYHVNLRAICWSHHPTLFKYLKETCGFRLGYVNQPEIQRFRNHLGQLVDLHDNIIMPDFERRGYSHNSPLRTANCLCIIPEKFTFTEKEYMRDHAELMKRQKQLACKTEAKP